MIKSEQVFVRLTESLTTGYIESKLQKLGIKPLRWAIVETNNDNYILNVSYLD